MHTGALWSRVSSLLFGVPAGALIFSKQLCSKLENYVYVP